VGVLRPITLYPFPISAFRRIANRARSFVVVEMSNGQLVEDVRLALNGARPVEFLGRTGGNVPSHHELLDFVRSKALEIGAVQVSQKEQIAYV
jgi:pyruvate/2-oxoacid:ferredoxin oxidoreductase alpha subunit